MFLLFWPTDQQRAQEQVLELLPMVSEVNAISEELNKHKYVWRNVDFTNTGLWAGFYLAPCSSDHVLEPKRKLAQLLNLFLHFLFFFALLGRGGTMTN